MEQAHAIVDNEQYFWLPLDRFILKLIERYDCLAMLRPRISTKCDLIRWSQIKSDPVEQYRVVYSIKKRLLEYLGETSKMFNNKSDNDEFDTIVPPNDITLMSFAPVFGHWLKESGFITSDLEKNDHEFTFEEYEKVFNNNKTLDKTRHHLYPTFEGILLAREKKIIKYKRIADDSKDSSSDSDGDDYFKKCRESVKEYIIHTPLEKADFDINTGEFDRYTYKKMMLYEFPVPLGDEPYTVENKSYFVYGIKQDSEVEPVSILFNDKSFNSTIDSSNGFLNTSITHAYHMSFSLKSRFDIQYVEAKTCGFELIESKVRKFTGSIDVPRYINGRLIAHKNGGLPIADVDSHNLEYYSAGGKTIKNERILKLESFEPSGVPVELTPYAKTLKTSDKSDITSHLQSCYSSFHDYYLYNAWINEIMSKSKTNYFHHDNGIFPVNKIMYEDLMMGFNMRSKFLPKKDSSIVWNNQDKQFILDHETGDSYWYERNIIPNENKLHEVIRINSQCIKFLGLIYDLHHENLDESFFRLKTYHISNSQNAIMEKDIEYPILRRAYPKITSLHDPKTEAKTTIEIKDPDRLLVSLPTENDNMYAKKIIIKMSTSDIVPFTKQDFEFLYGKNLMDSKAKALYIKLKPDNFAREKNPETFDELVNAIKENKKLLSDFIALRTIDPGEFRVPKEIIDIDKKINDKFATQDTSRVMDEIAEDNIKTIISIIMGNPTVISAKMLLYLHQWGFIVSGPDIKDLPFHKKDKDFYLRDLENEKYKRIVEELNKIDFYDPLVYSLKRESNKLAADLTKLFIKSEEPKKKDEAKKDGEKKDKGAPGDWRSKFSEAINKAGLKGQFNKAKTWKEFVNYSPKPTPEQIIKVKDEAEKLVKA
jgi:hypothetical protein